jgi:hypothetical protein
VPEAPELAISPSNCTDAKPWTSETAGIFSNCSPQWEIGEWGWNGSIGAKSSTCSSAPQQNRTVTCFTYDANGNKITLPDANCGTKPDTTKTLTEADYSTCSFAWIKGDWGWNGVVGAWSSTCSENAHRTRTVTCERSDGVPFADSYCASAGAKPATSETQLNVTDCSGMLVNGSFENGTTGWTFNSGGTLVDSQSSTIKAYDGDLPPESSLILM